MSKHDHLVGKYLVDYVYGEGVSENSISFYKITYATGHKLIAKLCKMYIKSNIWIPLDKFDDFIIKCNIIYTKKDGKMIIQHEHEGKEYILTENPLEWKLYYPKFGEDGWVLKNCSASQLRSFSHHEW